MTTKTKTATPKSKTLEPNPISAQLVEPSTILRDNRVRHSLLPVKVTSMAESIRDNAANGGPGVHTPIQICPLSAEEMAAHPGKLYRLITGDYRLTGLEKANEKYKLGLEILAIVTTDKGAKARMLQQLSENMDRQDMTLMDIAQAIDNMEREGFSKPEIRAAFPRLGKNNQPKEASNSWINIVHKFLDFPAKVQGLIARGEMGYDAAYRLQVKVEKIEEKAERDAVVTKVIEDIEQKRLDAIAAEEKQEAAFLAAEKKRIAKEQKEQAKAKELDDLKKLVAEQTETVKVRTEARNKASEAQAEAYKIKSNTKKGSEARKAADEALALAEKATASADAELATAEKILKLNSEKLAKLEGKAEEPETETETQTEAPLPQQTTTGQGGRGKGAKKKAATPAATPAQQPIKGSEVDAAAAKHGLEAKTKPLSLADVRLVLGSIRTMSDPNSQRKTFALGELLESAIMGKLGTVQDGLEGKVQKACAELTGEARKK